MFNISKDERLKAVNYRAGYVAFWVTSGLLLLGLFATHFLLPRDAVDPLVTGFVPWFIGVWVYVILLLRGGYLTAVHEERTRTVQSRRAVWLSSIVGSVLFGTITYLQKRFLPGHTPTSSESDIISSIVGALFFFAAMYWFTGRHVKWPKDDAL
ncbi:MAG: hypothetical protein IPP94_12340 [Ignavibacteria bacterium]|nr:hypothetical protein [Ignavibacteria bacterium]